MQMAVFRAEVYRMLDPDVLVGLEYSTKTESYKDFAKAADAALKSPPGRPVQLRLTIMREEWGLQGCPDQPMVEHREQPVEPQCPEDQE
jgi:hypothetical protein